MLDRTEESDRQPRRGIVVVDSDRTVQYRWVAEDTWAEWQMQPLTEANSVVRGLTGVESAWAQGYSASSDSSFRIQTAESGQSSANSVVSRMAGGTSARSVSS